MNKPSTKKMLTVLISLAMVFSALAVISMATQPAYAASGTITLDPTVFAVNTGTITYAKGGTFGAGATLTFYMSATNTFTSSSTKIGTVTLSAGSTALANAVTLTIPAGTAAGSYYVAASDDSGATFTTAVAITVSTATPSITISPSSAAAGSTVTITGTGFDSGSNVKVYLNYAGSVVLASSISEADLSTGASLTVPSGATGQPMGKYAVVAQELSGFSNSGITADSSLTITPSVTVTYASGFSSITGAKTSTFTVVGSGFPANDSFAASSALNPTNTITIDGVDAITITFTSSSAGYFSQSVGGLVTALTTYGINQISVTDETPTTFSDVGTILVSSPNPTALGFDFAVTPTYGSTINVGDSVSITVWNFPASDSLTFKLGSTQVGTLTADANGAGTLSSTIPAIPAGTYTPTATESTDHLVAVEPAITVSASFEAAAAGTSLTTANPAYGEYVPSAGTINVKAFGLNPSLDTYDFYDSIVAPSSTGMGVYASGLVTVSVGTGTSVLMQPAANGTLFFTYEPGYSSLTTPPSTGTPGIITSANGVPAYGSATASYQYFAIGAVSFTAPADLQIYTASSVSNPLTVTGLIPYTAALYTGVVNTYNAYIGPNELTLTFTTPSGSVTTGTSFNSEDTSITFTAVSGSSEYDFYIYYNGTITPALGTQPIVVSSPGSLGGAGAFTLVPTATGYDVAGYGYDPSLSSFTLYYATTSGLSSKAETLTSSGAFVDFSVLSPAPNVPAGTYAVFTSGTLSGSTYQVFSSYTITASLTLSPAKGAAGTSVTPTVTGLVPTSYYALLFNGVTLETGTPSEISAFTVPTVPADTYTVSIELLSTSAVVATASFKVTSGITLTPDPQAFPGELVSFTWAPSTTPSPATGTPVYVTVYLNGSAYTTVQAHYSAGPPVTLSGSFQMPNGMPDTNMSVSFGWSYTVTTPESVVVTNGWTSAETASVKSLATPGTSTLLPVTLNNTMFSTLGNISLVLATGGATGTFPATTAPSVVSASFVVLSNTVTESGTSPYPITGSITYYVTGQYTSSGGTFPFNIPVNTLTFSVASPTASTGYHVTSPAASTYQSASTVNSVSYSSYTGASTASIELISGNGALLTGISSGQIATITADVTSAVKTSLQVPLSELNASVVAINGAVAKINTAFGNMTATLKSINATVQSISSGQVLVLTKLGSVETSLASLNASLTAFNGNIVTINTTLGQVKTTLAGINAQVTTNGNGIATISTDLGTLSGVVTSTNGNVSTIKTNLGTLTTTVGKINTNTQGFSTLEIFLIVAIVLILITLVIAFLAVSNTNKLSKKFEEQKKQ
jgi:hypothetical protein